MNEWRTCRLSEIAEVQTGPFGSQLHAYDYQTEGIPVIMPVNIGDNKIIEDNIARISLEKSLSMFRHFIREGDIVYSRRGDIERKGFVSSKESGWICGTGCLKVRPDSQKVSSKFISYALGTKKVKEYLKSNAVGTTMPNLNTGILASVVLELPSLESQTQIASILSCLDDKIELNLQMNQTLETMAQANFKEWFVNFNFPGFDGELVDGLPKGWRMGKLKEVISFIKGKKPNDISIERQDGYLPEILIDTFNTGNSVFANPSKMVIATEEEMLMVMDGASSGRIEIGYSGIVGSTIAKINLQNQFCYPFFIYFFLQSKEQDMMGNTTGSSIPHADKNKILDYDLTIPENETLELFEQTANSILEKIKTNKSEIKTLTQIRDSLLPKLMTGKIEVRG